MVLTQVIVDSMVVSEKNGGFSELVVKNFKVFQNLKKSCFSKVFYELGFWNKIFGYSPFHLLLEL